MHRIYFIIIISRYLTFEKNKKENKEEKQNGKSDFIYNLSFFEYQQSSSVTKFMTPCKKKKII